MARLFLVLLVAVQVELIFDPNGDGISDGLMWNTPVVAYLEGKPVAYATTGRDSSVYLDLEPGDYRFRAWVKNRPVITHGYWLCQKLAEIAGDTRHLRISCRHRFLQFLPLVGGGS